jgi:branched-subunit amino acid ABC-type transport system permease component
VSASEVFQLLVSGIGSGSLYGLLAVGLVLTYRTSGVFNIAHGSVAAVSAYVFYYLREDVGIGWFPVLLLCVFVLGPLMGLALERMARFLAQGGTAPRIIATVGLQVGIIGLLQLLFGPPSRTMKPFLPSGYVTVGSVRVGNDLLLVVVVAAASVAGLYAFLRMSRIGVWMRAVVDDPALLGLAGRNAFVVRAASWILGCSFAALSGILLASLTSLDVTLLSFATVQAFGAAAIGLFRSLPMSYLGGLIVGVLADESTLLTQHVHASGPTMTALLQGIKPSVPFLVLFAVLLLVPRRELVEPGSAGAASGGGERVLPAGLRWGGLAASGVFAVLVPVLIDDKLSSATRAVILVVMFHSLNLLVRTSGQISLCHASFVALGASSFSHFATDARLPWLLAVLAAGLVVVPVGAIVAIPAIRLSGLYLALATLGFGILMQNAFYATDLMFGPIGGIPAPRPGIWGLDSDTRFYYVCLALAVTVAIVVGLINRGRLGRLLQALGESPVSLATLGLTVNVIRVGVFCICAFLAGVAGALLASQGGSASGQPYNAFVSLLWLAVLGLSGRGRQSAPIIAAVSLALVPSYIDNSTFTEVLPVLFGVGAIVAACAESVSSGSRRSGSARPTGRRSAERGLVAPRRAEVAVGAR